MPTCGDCGVDVDDEESVCPSCGATVGDRPGSLIDEAGPDTWGASEPGVTHGPGSTGAAGGAPTAAGGDGPADEASASSDREAAEESTAAAASGAGTDGTEAEASGTEAGGADTPETTPEGPSPYSRDGFSFGASFGTRESLDPVLIGAGLAFLSLIPVVGVFAALLVFGFGFRCCGAAARGQASPPAWGNYEAMFGDGLRLAAIVTAYGTALLVLGGGTGLALGVVNETAGSLAFLGWTFVVGYGFPASLTAYAAHGSIRAAFAPSVAGQFAFTGTYVKAYVVWIIARAVIGVVTVISLITVVGAFAVFPWAQYFEGSLWGYYYRQAVERGEVPAAPADPV